MIRFRISHLHWHRPLALNTFRFGPWLSSPFPRTLTAIARARSTLLVGGQAKCWFKGGGCPPLFGQFGQFTDIDHYRHPIFLRFPCFSQPRGRNAFSPIVGSPGNSLRSDFDPRTPLDGLVHFPTPRFSESRCQFSTWLQRRRLLKGESLTIF